MVKKKNKNTAFRRINLFEEGSQMEGSGGGGNFMSNASQIIGTAGMFDSLAQSTTSAIDASRSGVSGQPTVLVEGVLGGQSGSHWGNMWNTKAKTQEALDYVKQQGNATYGGMTSNDLLSQRSNVGKMQELNIDTRGKELEDFIFDPFSYIVTSIAGTRETADERQARINRAIGISNIKQERAYDDALQNFRKSQKTAALANYAAFGGPIIGTPFASAGASGYDIAKDNALTKQMQIQTKNSTSFNPIFNSTGYDFAEGGGIHIAPSKRGTFTAAAKKHGKSVQAFASQVLANPENYSPAMRKKANFARNAAKWHADGGMLMSDEFTNGVTLVDQGGTHENNPHEGVQMGIAPDGTPNLVEEGEAIYRDYVYSNRLRVPKEVRNKYKLRGPKDMTFAEAFRSAQKDSEERPNDPISEDGLENIAMILARTQEAVRGYERSHKKARGGHMYDGLTENWTPEEYYRVYGVWPEEMFPTQSWTPEEIARVSGNDVTTGPDIAGTVQQTVAPKSDGDVKDGKDKGDEGDKNKRGASNILRYAAPVANLGAVISDIAGITNTPTTFNYIPGFHSVGYKPLGDYLPETHFDTRYAANQAAQQAAATRNAIMQSTAPGRNAALLAADFNAQIANGELLRQGALQDYEMMLQRAQFNRGTNQANSDMDLKGSLANQDARLRYAQAALQQARLNEENSNLASSAKAQNISNLAESLSGIGEEEYNRDLVKWLADHGVFGVGADRINAAHGGKLRKKKKGLTY